MTEPSSARRGQAFDPYFPPQSSLLDNEDHQSPSNAPGTAGFLEMEEEPPRSPAAAPRSPYDPITTSSGLLLTHRRTPNSSHIRPQIARLETEHPYSRRTRRADELPFVMQTKRLLGWVRLWVALSSVVLFVGLAVVIKHMRHEQTIVEDGEQEVASSSIRLVALEEPTSVLLLPLEELEHSHKHRRLRHLYDEFEDWMARHGRQYHSEEEKERRFEVWTANHRRTMEKNERHGPCRLTKQPVFGDNHLKDLTEQEFRDRFLNAHHSERKPMERGLAETPPVTGPHINAKRHPEVHRRMNEAWRSPKKRTNLQSCKWYDASCYLQYFFENYVYQYYGTMEPAYDADSYPTAVDWRDIGAVTNVHSQGNCGACYAITAVETIESATFINTGKLYDLAESEIIVCAEDCEMCSGGWPQSAFDYVMDNGGLPLENDIPYDGDFLLALTEANEGTSDTYDQDYVEEYRQGFCPNGGKSGSGDSSGGNSYSRYGDIEGYGYATDKCVCYTDGSGCDCDSQNEGLAVRNLATYGPAVVCVDAATWQDYSGGIITSDSGCSSKFMDVNHCVQAVGYAFASASDEEDDGENGQSGSGSQKSGSADDEESSRIGYWIVRNQWSSYWGMQGYAYVAMGDNTCGILNDMVQVYA